MIWSWAALLTVYLTNVSANVKEWIKKKVLLYCNISFRGLPCYWLYLWPFCRGPATAPAASGVTADELEQGISVTSQHCFHPQPRKTVTAAAQEDCVSHSSTLSVKLRQWCGISPLLLLLCRSQSPNSTLPVLPACLYFQFNVIIQRPLSDSKTKFITT